MSGDEDEDEDEDEEVNNEWFIASYAARNGHTRWVIVRDEGENGYSVPSMMSGCHTYQARQLSVVVRYSAAHGTSYASRGGAMRALRRDYGYVGAVSEMQS